MSSSANSNLCHSSHIHLEHQQVRVRNASEVSRLCSTLKREGSPLGIRVTLSRSRASEQEDDMEKRIIEPLNLDRKLEKLEKQKQPLMFPMYRKDSSSRSSPPSRKSIKTSSNNIKKSTLRNSPSIDPLAAPIKISPSKYRKRTQDEIEESRRHFRQFRSDMAKRTISAGQLWFFMDPHRSGRVKLSQFSRGLEEAGIHRSENMIEELFQRIDINGDGRIEWSEFNMIVGKLFSRPEHHHIITKPKHKIPNLNQSPRIDSRMPKETMDRLVTSSRREHSKEEEEEDIMSIDDDVDNLGEELARHAISEGQLWFFMDSNRTGVVRGRVGLWRSLPLV